MYHRSADLSATIAVTSNGQPNKSLDASGWSAFLNLLGAAEGALIRATASTQTFDASLVVAAGASQQSWKVKYLTSDAGKRLRCRNKRSCSESNSGANGSLAPLKGQ